MVMNLTHPQKRIWYIEKIHTNSPLHNIGGCLHIKGRLSTDLFMLAIQNVIRSHEGMHLRFAEESGEPYQYVNEDNQYNIDFMDFSNYEEPKGVMENWAQEQFDKPFELENKVLYYIVIYKISESEYGLLLKIHHIISDGWSTAIIQQQICDQYANLLEGKKQLPAIYYSYVDYIDKEKKYFQSKRFLKNKAYWHEKFSDMPEFFLYKGITSLEAKRQSFIISQEMSVKINNFIVDHRTSLNTFFITVMLIYLHKVLNQEDIVLGTPVMNRTDKEDKQTVGMYTSTVPVRMNINPDWTINELFKAVILELKQSYIHQKYPYDLLITDLGLNKKGYDSLFKICVNYYNTQYFEHVAGFPAEVREYHGQNQSYSMQLIVNEWTNKEIKLNFDYKINEYAEEEIHIMYESMHHILNQIVIDPTRLIKDIHLCSEEEFHKRIYALNSTKASYPHDKAVHQIFEEQVEKTPDHVALHFEGKTISYRELNDKANQLALLLEKQGVTKEKIIAIRASHSFELIIAILGVLKAGGAYLPIEPTYPIERINFMLTDSEAILLLTNDDLPSGLEFQGRILDLRYEEIYTVNSRNVDRGSSANDLVYMIYTSGSTGNPKGVMIEHQNLINYIWWANKTYAGENEIFALYSSISFDLTVTSIFAPLIAGNQISIYADDGGEFILDKVMKENQATIIKLTPAHLTLIKDMDNRNSSVKKMIVGGDNLKVTIAKEVVDSFGGVIEIYNEYGPTEATVGCMTYKYDVEKDSRGSVPIGVAIDNTQIYLLNKYFGPIPTGLPGEIYISGDGVARGYLNRHELTERIFIDNPFRPGEKMYKTGDIARYLPDGNIEYIGRNDNQVKLRGYRIELGEIEKFLLDYKPINDVVVRVKGKLLYAYYVSEKALNVGELKIWLLKHLPTYMIPNKFVFLEQLPLTVNGKVNFNLLGIEDDNVKEIISYRSHEEKELIHAMEEILGVKDISMNDDFYQIGGDSIKAIQIASKLKNSNIDITVKDILSKGYIEEIAAAMTVRENVNPVDQDRCTGVVEMTPIMEWFLAQDFKEANHYNQSILLSCKKAVNSDYVRKCIDHLIEHHDMLRLNYNEDQNEWYYRNDFSNDVSRVEYFDLSNEADCFREKKIKDLGYQIKSSFDLKIGPLLKGCIFNLGEEEQLILLTAHHLVVDGISWRILIEDFVILLEQFQQGDRASLPLKTNSFSDWSNHLHTYSQGISEMEMGYWREVQMKDAYFPVEFEQGPDDISSSVMVKAELDKQLLDEFSQKIYDIYGLTLHEGLIVALLLTLKPIMQQDLIVIDLEGHGRETIHEELDVSRTVGWFTSIYPAYFNVQDLGLDVQLKTLKEQLKKIPNKGFHFGILQFINQTIPNDTSKRVRFNYLGDFDSAFNNSFLRPSYMDCGLNSGNSNHLTALIDIVAMVVNQKFHIEITFSKNRFYSETMQGFLNNYIEKIKEIARFCAKKNNKEFTPSDFKLDISQDELDDLFQ
ncbi:MULTISPECIES: non-ribosomal peptide synthetase [unclassified Paenibacillus]|uniref:non-ribosomal peptide synthetase n=1 Tax=unclassified Paenibacillus TaxID=185978 RepID=UPI0009A9058E|nr:MULTISPECIES: non-ribosomal peptide synthetase [unclassified Paenibacillus]SLK22665.1 non-ribosomal peptide synthase domain TIGR01720/amino acid adenylation domain-containing protein [Paenibacillus sp. RU5A]SOC77358.1 non-ribosomal peptide synthase domain TIGR01720/amino acid adenylation domain-containing protein [Paenibacillus sp. RU26A]SOC78391.1 non-ribosomal peptide synthase domain TIGR01720/amino acid adenylation domain-containing protein [Paenibacillus sp. RU5M]